MQVGACSGAAVKRGRSGAGRAPYWEESQPIGGRSGGCAVKRGRSGGGQGRVSVEKGHQKRCSTWRYCTVDRAGRLKWGGPQLGWWDNKLAII